MKLTLLRVEPFPWRGGMILVYTNRAQPTRRSGQWKSESTDLVPVRSCGANPGSGWDIRIS
jgi:hypothetical protein